LRRNPAKDQVAIVGIGRFPFTRDDPGRSIAAITVDACVEAVRDAGLTASDIDGVCGSLAVSDVEMQLALGLPEVRWSVNHRIPFGFQLQRA
jgi:acetyl-CoA acetyltransferase